MFEKSRTVILQYSIKMISTLKDTFTHRDVHELDNNC